MNTELKKMMFRVLDIRSTEIAYASHGLEIWIFFY